MLLAVDIGNTTIAAGLFKEKKLFKKFWLPSKASSSSIYREFKKSFNNFNIKPELVKMAILSSVVPYATKTVKEILSRRFNIRTILLGRDIIVPIKNLYKKPEQVGQDRLVNAYACLKLYGAPAIIVDFGTATTFDFLDKKGAYCGGLITPGVELSLEALAQKTALLPEIELKKPRRLVGRDTVESMRSGVLYGLASMCDGIIEKIRKQCSPRARVLATGGLATFFAPYCRHIDCIDKDLTLKGLYLVSWDVFQTK